MRSDIRLRSPGLRPAGAMLPVLTREGDVLVTNARERPHRADRRPVRGAVPLGEGCRTVGSRVHFGRER
jgi:hypothetical protein